MHIAVEATRLLKEQRGIGRYVRNLLRSMPEVDARVRYTLYTHERDIDGLQNQMASIPGVAPRTQIEPLSRLRSTGADVAWYAWNWILHPTHTTPMVPTILDLVPMQRFDHRWWKFLKRAKARRRSKRTVDLASSIIVISEFTRQEVTRLLDVSPSRMQVTLLAADDFDATPLAHSEALTKLGIAGPYFLAVGAQEARKNLIVLFRAMEELYASGVRAPLVLCGPGATLEGFARKHPAPWLRYAGYVSDAELATLYSKTTALVFPSRYEGFGLPVLEAMAAGAPVVCSSASSIPEVGGDAALYFDPDDVSGLAAQMRRLLDDGELRTQCVTAGREQAARFSWRKCAEETLECFRLALR